MQNFFKRFGAAVAVLFIVACGGGGPIGQAINHRKAMLAIVEKNKTDATAAATELEKYLKDHEAELKTLEADMEKLKKEVGDDEAKQMDMIKDHMSDVAAMMEQEQKLRTEAKEVWSDDRVRAAMRSVKGL